MSLTGMKVLLAEDDPINQMVAMHMLESLGADATLAVDGAEALSLLDDRNFDAVVVDIEMPRISGLELIRRLRSTDGTAKSMPIVALTACVMRENRAAIEDAGADGIIAKPIVSIEDFGKTLSDFMRECRGRTTCGNNASDSGAIARLRPDALQLEAASLERRRLDNHRIPNNSIGSDPAQTGPQRDTSQAPWHREVVEMGVACERLVTAIHEGDRHGAERAAQGIRVLSGAIGAVRLQELTCRVNAADRRGEGTPLEEIGTKVLVEVERVLRSLAPGLQCSAGVAGMA